MGSIWETISFTARSISTKHQQSAGLELISSLFVLLAPLWINAFSYMVLARMIHFFLPSHSLFIPASVLSLIFVSLDFVSFVIQIVGGSYAGPTSPQDQIMKGIHIYMGGIGLQQFFIFIFLGLAVKFHVQMLALDRLGLGKDGWKRLLFTLYGSLGFITVRPSSSISLSLLGGIKLMVVLRIFRSASSFDSSSSLAAKRHLIPSPFMNLTSIYWKRCRCSALFWYLISLIPVES